MSEKDDVIDQPPRGEIVAGNHESWQITDLEELRNNPAQCRIELLDYLRRGRLADGIDIMPEFVNALPKLLDAKDGNGQPLIDFDARDYNHTAIVKMLLNIFTQTEQDIVSEDAELRRQLSIAGFRVKPAIFVDQNRHKAVVSLVGNYLSGIDPESLRKIKSEDPKGIKKKQSINKLKAIGLLENSDEELALILDAAEGNPDILGQKLEASTGHNPIAKFIRDFVCKPQDKGGSYNPERNGFVKIPKLSEYKGDVFEPEQIDLKNVRLRAHMDVVKRGDIVAKRASEGGGEVVGATIIDGNLGYKESGEVFEEDGITIIDHHDQLEKQYSGKKYDTATVMVVRILQDELRKAGWDSKSERFGRGWQEGIKSFINKFGAFLEDTGGERKKSVATGEETRRLRLCVNHLDSDSILSSWAFRQPNIALKYRDIITKISTCGDFLLGSGVMEYGATARDYEYIIRNLIEECQNKTKEQRAVGFGQPIKDVDVEIQSYFPKSNVDLDKPMSAIDHMVKEVEDTDEELVNLKKQLASAEGPDKRLFAERIKTRKGQIEELRQLSELGRRVAELAKKKEALKKDLEQKIGKALSPEENTIVLNYLMSRLEDIIINPFKYRKFLEAERAKEQKTIELVEQACKSGEMDITPDQKQGIVIIEPGAGKTKLPDYESIDGLYFFLRRRVDLFLPIVVSHEENFVSVAINTQNAGDLNKYDFNILVDKVKLAEEQKIQAEIDKLFPLAGTDKKADKRLKELQTDLINNRQGKLWRNRTQMMFCMKTHQKFDDIMEMVREWKDGCESEEKMRDVLSRVKANIKRVQDAGKWGEEIDPSAALLERIPTKIGDRKPGFDAGIACALDLIPKQAQELSAMLHANYTPETVQKVQNEVDGHIENLSPDSETCWWLAACSVCEEGGGVDTKSFLGQIEKFKHLAENPEARKKAAMLEYRHMIDKTEKVAFTNHDTGEVFEAPFGTEDGCIQGAYILGSKFGVCETNRPEAGNKYYELGTYEDSLGLEGFVCTAKYLRGGVEKDSGPVHGSKQFYRFGSLEDLQRALAIVQKKFSGESVKKRNREMPIEMEYIVGKDTHDKNVRELGLQNSPTFNTCWKKMVQIKNHGPNHDEGSPALHTQLFEGEMDVYLHDKLGGVFSESDQRLLRLAGVLHDLGKADTQQFDVVSQNQNKLVGATEAQIKSAEDLFFSKLQKFSGRDLSNASKSEIRKIRSQYDGQIQQMLQLSAEPAIVANFRGHERAGVGIADQIVAEAKINLSDSEKEELRFMVENHMAFISRDSFNLSRFEKLFVKTDGSVDERRIALLRAMAYADDAATFNANSKDSKEVLKEIDASLRALRQEHEQKRKK